MKANKIIPTEIYESIYDAIIAAAEEHDIEDEYDTSFSFYIEEGEWTVEGVASLPTEYIDDSFTHAFGIEERGHFEHTFDSMPDVEEITVYFGEDGEEVEFDYDKFFSQFDVTERKLRNGDVIRQGDVVLATNSTSWGYRRYERVVFDHYNTVTGEWFCKEIYRNEPSRYVSTFRGVIPATEENISKYRVA